MLQYLNVWNGVKSQSLKLNNSIVHYLKVEGNIIHWRYLISRAINHSEELFLIRKNICRNSLDARIFHVWSSEFFIDFISVAAKKPFLSDRWQYIFLNLPYFFKGNLWLNFRWIQGYYGYPNFWPCAQIVHCPIPQCLLNEENCIMRSRRKLHSEQLPCCGVFHLPLLIHQGVIEFCVNFLSEFA